MKPRISPYVIAFSIFAVLPFAQAQAEQPTDDSWGRHDFRVTSTTISNGGTLPLSMILNTSASGYQCTYFTGGGNQSPQLSWSNAPRGTRSFTVIAYDVTGTFTHWGMYNISHKTTALPENAGVAGSTLGTQVGNDFGDASYDGPCPPPQYNPPSHNYVFTVYALDIELPTIPAFGDFTPPGPESLYHALIDAQMDGHILDRASISTSFPGSK